MITREEDRSILSAPQPEPAQTVQYGPEIDHVADVFHPEDATSDRCAVILHGGFWRPHIDRLHARQFAAALSRSGWHACLVEYRREPGSPDRALSDVERALERVPHLAGCSSTAPFLVGHSAGGHLAIIAAGRQHFAVAAVVGLAPVSNLRRADELGLGGGAVRDFLGCPATGRLDLDPSAQPALNVPLVVLHGRDDSVVPAEMSVETVPTLGDDCRVLVIDDAAHFELIDPAQGANSIVIAAVNQMWDAATRGDDDPE